MAIFFLFAAHQFHKSGITICFNGWDNVTWHPLLNGMLTSLNGDVFIGSTIGEWKDAHYLCNALAGYIESLELITLYKFVQTMLQTWKCSWPFNPLFSKSWFFKLCFSLFRLTIGRLGKNNMGKTNCEKNKSYCFFHITTPCATINFSLLWNKLNTTKPH